MIISQQAVAEKLLSTERFETANSSKNFSLAFFNSGLSHSIITWYSDPISPDVHNEQNLSTLGIFFLLPDSISKLWSERRTFVTARLLNTLFRESKYDSFPKLSFKLEYNSSLDLDFSEVIHCCCSLSHYWLHPVYEWRVNII